METSETQKTEKEVKSEFKQEEIQDVEHFLNQTDEDINPNLFDSDKSKVLILQKINVAFKPKFIANMFGCFGNVVKILVNKMHGFCLIEFQNDVQADNAFKSLNNLTFFNHTLKIKFSKYDHLSFKDKKEQQDLIYFENDPKAFRYRADNSIRINEPSSILHFTGIPEAITPIVLYQMITFIHEPSRIIQLKKNSKGFMMFLVQLDSLENAIEVLSVLHNKQINEKFLKISFSHSKLE